MEFISVLAQAQRAVASQGIDRLMGTVGQLAGMKPEILDKVDFDQVVDDYSDMFGVNPKLIVPDDVVANIRAQRAQAMQAEKTAAAMPATVDAIKTVGDTNLGGVQEAQDIMSSLMGYGTPSPSQV